MAWSLLADGHRTGLRLLLVQIKARPFCFVLSLAEKTLLLIIPSSSTRSLRNETRALGKNTQCHNNQERYCPTLSSWWMRDSCQRMLTLWKDRAAACISCPGSKITSAFLSCCKSTVSSCPCSFCPSAGLMFCVFFPPLCFRAHRWGDPEVRHPCLQRS